MLKTKVMAGFISTVAVVGGMVIGMMVAVCFLYTDAEIAHNALDFWRFV